MPQERESERGQSNKSAKRLTHVAMPVPVNMIGKQMRLQKAFDRINTAADRSFPAACRCQSDSCSCNDLADGQTLFHTLQANKETNEMSSSFINRLSAAERTKLADTISAANEHLTLDERRDLVDALTVALAGDLKAKSAADKKHEILSRIYAAENDVRNGGKAEIDRANNTMKYAGVAETVQELAFKSVPEVDAIFAAARKLPHMDRIAVKRVMDRRFGWGN